MSEFTVIVNRPEVKEKVVAMSEMEPLDCGYIVYANSDIHVGDLVMRTADSDYFEVMCLSDLTENSCWDKNNGDTQVRLLNKGEKVTLQIEGDA